MKQRLKFDDYKKVLQNTWKSMQKRIVTNH